MKGRTNLLLQWQCIIFFAVNKYINILGIAQLVGLIFTPALGPYIDRDPKLDSDATYDEYKRWKIRRCAIALFITNSVDVIMGIAVLIPSSEAQVFTLMSSTLTVHVNLI